MSEGGGVAVGTFVTMGVAYIFAEGVALAAAIAAIGFVLAVVIMGGLAVLGLVTYGKSFRRAVARRDAGWALDHFLAPLIATVATLLLFGLYLKAAASIVHFDNNLIHRHGGSRLPGDFLALGMGLIGVTIILAAPYFAIAKMSAPGRPERMLSYLGFVVTGAYWGVGMLLAVKYPHLHPGQLVPECNCAPDP